MLNEFVTKVVMALAPFVALLTTYLLTLAVQYLSSKVKNDKLKEAINQIGQSAMSVVKEMNQTVVAELKMAAEDGVLTPEEAAAVKAKALARLVEIAPNQAMKIIESQTGALAATLEALIEEAVVNAKQE